MLLIVFIVHSIPNIKSIKYGFILMFELCFTNLERPTLRQWEIDVIFLYRIAGITCLFLITEIPHIYFIGDDRGILCLVIT